MLAKFNSQGGVLQSFPIFKYFLLFGIAEIDGDQFLGRQERFLYKTPFSKT